ncbi:MAG: glycosyltransferase involved in cell wall biosynthesis [Candidatus Pelagisphaera sp.]|jgi:glycosyltransferase involved in cell wall biosynthesis
MMNVLIDLRWMVIGRVGGMEQMAFELVASIAGVNRVDRFWLYCPIATFEEWEFESGSRVELIDSDRFKLVSEFGYSDSFGSSGPSKRLGVVQRGGLIRENRRIVNIDLVHSVGGYIAEELREYRGILTIHDLQHVHFPENFDEGELSARKANYQASIDAASAVICVSESVRKDVLANFKVDSGKVVTLWNIPSGASLPQLPDHLVKNILGKLGLDSGYLFFPSHAWAHKNHERLILAFAKVKQSNPETKLVLTGGKFGSDHPAAKRIREFGFESSVTHLGFRTPFEIRCLYRAAGALVYPSLFEGFGMPVAEAILAGTPVVCSDIAPLREIGGDAVATFDPRSPDAIASVILKVIGDSEMRASLLEKGTARRIAFSPEGIARDTCELYRLVVGLGPIEYDSYVSKRDLRRERAQHWGRVFRVRMEAGSWFGGSIAWLRTFGNSPLMALRAKDGYLKRAETSELRSASPFKGRYGDGWIGPEFQDWLMVPKGARGMELSLEAPPSPYVDGMQLELFLEEKSLFKGGFKKSGVLAVSVDLVDDLPGIVSMRATCDRYFVPREHGLSEDSRKLSAKLVGIRWLF